VQAPDQPAKIEPAAAVALRVTCVPTVNVAVQDDPQSMPAGVEVTTPVPVPLLVTVSRYVGVTLKRAVTLRARFIVTVHTGLEPLQPFDQLANADPGAGVAVNVTIVPDGKNAEQVEPQFTPAGSEVTVPVPVPLLETLSP
jgi:hypothetical protein